MDKCRGPNIDLLWINAEVQTHTERMKREEQILEDARQYRETLVSSPKDPVDSPCMFVFCMLPFV
jgi:hypothetical protein